MTHDSNLLRSQSSSNSTSRPDKIYLTATQVRRRYGGITSMTLHRWLKRNKLHFPKPSYFNRLRYWELAELEAWERSGKRGAGERSDSDAEWGGSEHNAEDCA